MNPLSLTMRGRAEVARRAHNPEVLGSNPSPATVFQTTRNGRFWFHHAFFSNILM
jgi:hypothetical protein